MKNTVLAGAILAALTLTAAPTAHAAPTPQPAPAAQSAAAVYPTGLLHLYEDYYYQNWCDDYEGNSSDWGYCRNKVSSIHNNGYPGNYDDVYVYWGRNHSGARRGIHNGVALENLGHWRFDNAGSGANEILDDNIASHRWVNLP